MQSTPLWQPFVCTKAQGLQAPTPWFNDPMLAKSELARTTGATGALMKASGSGSEIVAGNFGEWAGGGGTNEWTGGMKILQPAPQSTGPICIG